MLAVAVVLPVFILNIVYSYRVMNIVLPTILMLMGVSALYFFILGMLGDLIVRAGNHDTAEYARTTAMELN